MEKTITLQQGLEQFLEKNRELFSARSVSDEGKEFLQCHDIAHVVFGCDTSIYGEGVVKLWTTFGTTLSFWEVITGYNEANAFELFKMYSFGHVMRNIGQFLLVIPKAIARARRMSKPWPFSDYERYLDTPIFEIRKEFNVHVL